MPKTQTKTAPKSAPVTKAAKPSVELHNFGSKWTGPSDVTNKNLSRTKIDASKFNAYPKGNVTQRDQDAINALRQQFGYKEFERRNVDAGILRRLMERGLVRIANGDCNTSSGKFALTKAGMGQAAAA